MKKTLLLCALLALGVSHPVAYAERAIDIIADGGAEVFSGSAAEGYAMLSDYTRESLEKDNDNLSATFSTLDMAGHDFTLIVNRPSGTNVTIGALKGTADSAYHQDRTHGGKAVWNSLWVDNAAEFAGTISMTGNASTKKLIFGVGSTDAAVQADFSKATAVTLTNMVMKTASSDAVFKKLVLNNVDVKYSDGSQSKDDTHKGTAEKQSTLTIGAGSSLTNATLASYINLKITGNTSIQNSTVNNVTVDAGTLALGADVTYAADSIVTAGAGTMLDVGGSSTQTMHAIRLGEGSELLVRMNCSVGTAASAVDIAMGNGSVITLYGGKVSGDITVDQAATIRGSRNNANGTVSGTITGSGVLTLGADPGKYGNAWTVSSVISEQDGQSLSLLMDSYSTVTLSGDNTYSGGTTINRGTMLMQSAAALGTGDVMVAAGANLAFHQDLTAATVGALTLSNGAAITLHNDHTGTLTTSGLTVNGNATFNGNLVVAGGTITFADDATLTMGCDVAIGQEDMVTIMLTDSMVEQIALGNRVVLFENVDSDKLGSSITFGGNLLASSDVYALHYDADNKTYYVSPEPATATLSLLALAGLAARRKRH